MSCLRLISCTVNSSWMFSTEGYSYNQLLFMCLLSICFVLKQQRIQMQNTKTPQEIAQTIKAQTWTTFTSKYNQKFKKMYDPSLFTIVASISLVNLTDCEHHMVSIGFGTKSLPLSVMQQHQKDDLLCDLHAQMLAIQGFKRFLLEEIMKKGSHYLSRNETTDKYRIKEGFGVYLYCSQIFCGDCCVSLKEQSFSGAKPLKYLKCQQYPELKYESNILRTKPGRLDLPINKRSPILSCSDKIGFFNLVGLQGPELFAVLTPVYLHTVIVDSSLTLRDNLSRGIDLVERLSQLLNRPSSLIQRQLFNIVMDGKERKMSHQFDRNKPNFIIIDKGTSQLRSRDREGFELCGIMTDNETEWINGRSGLPQGSSLKNYKTKGKVSQFSQTKLKEKFGRQSSEEDTFKYRAVEDRLRRLFGQWL